MLQNNLDPDVAERPEELVVLWGHPGVRATATGSASTKILECLRDLNDDESLLIQSGKPSGRIQDSCWTHRGCWLANFETLGAQVGDMGAFPRARSSKACFMVREQMDGPARGFYIGTQGIVQGTYETFRGGRGRQTLRRAVHGRSLDPYGGSLGGMGRPRPTPACGPQPSPAAVGVWSAEQSSGQQASIDLFRLRTPPIWTRQRRAIWDDALHSCGTTTERREAGCVDRPCSATAAELPNLAARTREAGQGLDKDFRWNAAPDPS